MLTHFQNWGVPTPLSVDGVVLYQKSRYSIENVKIAVALWRCCLCRLIHFRHRSIKHKLLNSMTSTRDHESGGHANVNVTFRIFACFNDK